MRRRPLLVTVCLALTALALLAAPARAGAATRPAAVAGGAAAASTAGQEPDAPADDGTGGSADDDGIVEPIPGDDIIPEPDSGREPEEAGDRGGALQILVFVLIVSGVGGMVAMIVRESRRNRAHQT
jgi:hypothetical protein